jgi:selenocysteine lyase/cysteine desulfurase
MTGTQNHEGIAGTLAAVEYLAALGRHVTPSAAPRREAIQAAFAAIRAYEAELCGYLLRGLARLTRYRVWGIPDPDRSQERVPTVSFTHTHKTAREVATFLADRGIFVWDGNFYALPVSEALGREPEGMVRVGLLHYNTVEEVDRLLEALEELDA